MRPRILPAVVAALAAATAVPTHAQAPPADATTATPLVTTVAANINISPKRITVDPARRNATVLVVNQGNVPVTIDITMIDRIMQPDGQIVAVEDASKKPALAPIIAQLHSAKDLLQISPRRVTLQPGKAQTIRLRLASLPEGEKAAEYRSHLTVTTVPPPDSGVTAEAAANAAQNRQLSFRISAVYGVSIPAIVRTSTAAPAAQLANLHLTSVEVPDKPDQPPKKVTALALDIVRQGPNSLYGVIEIRSERQKKGDTPLGFARGVGVYPEIDHRSVMIPLTRAPAAGEKLDVTFTDDDTSPGKVLAKSTL